MEVKQFLEEKKELEQQIADLTIAFLSKFPFVNLAIDVNVMRGDSIGSGLYAGKVNMGVEVKVKAIV